MNKPLGKTLATLLLLAAGMLFVDRAAAEAPKPALTIAFAGYDTLNSDVKALDEIDSHLGLATKLEAMLKAATKGKNLAGLDKSRPWGVTVALGDSDEPVSARLPSRHRPETAHGRDSLAQRRGPLS